MLGAIMHATQRSVTTGERVAGAVDRLNTAIGHGVSWLTLLMVAVTFVVVVLRYFFDTGWIWLQETIVWMHAMVFLLGAAYTLRAGEHVRVDIVYRRMPSGVRGWIDLAGTLLLLLPFCGFLVYASYDYVAESWFRSEASREAGGLPFPFVPLAKSAIVAMAVLLALQGVSMIAHALARIAGRPIDADDEVSPGSEL